MKKQIIITVITLTFLISCNSKKVEKADGFIFKTGKLYDNNGNSIESSLDDVLQNYVDSLLRTNLVANKASGACAVIMDTKSGAIKALVNLYQKPDGSYTADSNLAVNHYYEFGGIFKLYSAMALIEDGFAKAEDSVLVGDGTAIIGGVPIEESHVPISPKLTLKDGFIQSSNLVFSSLVYDAYKSKPERFVSHLSNTYLNKPLEIDILNYNSPTLMQPGTASWDSSSLQYMSIGYGVKLSPLQILAYYNSIANNGIMVFPYFASINKSKIENKRVCKTETALVLRSFMESTNNNITSNISTKERIYFGGKSGTAIVSSNGRDTYLSSFIGYFPATTPKYTCLVMFNNPQNGEFYGSIVSKPVFNTIADFLVK